MGLNRLLHLRERMSMTSTLVLSTTSLSISGSSSAVSLDEQGRSPDSIQTQKTRYESNARAATARKNGSNTLNNRRFYGSMRQTSKSNTNSNKKQLLPPSSW